MRSPPAERPASPPISGTRVLRAPCSRARLPTSHLATPSAHHGPPRGHRRTRPRIILKGRGLRPAGLRRRRRRFAPLRTSSAPSRSRTRASLPRHPTPPRSWHGCKSRRPPEGEHPRPHPTPAIARDRAPHPPLQQTALRANGTRSAPTRVRRKRRRLPARCTHAAGGAPARRSAHLRIHDGHPSVG